MGTSDYYTIESGLLVIEGRELDERNMILEVKRYVSMPALPFNGYIITLDN